MNFLLEIGVEELPAEYARSAWQQLFDSRLLSEALGAGAKVLGGGGGHYTPRRIAFFAGNVPEKHPDLTVNVSGPAKKVAFDAEGKPTKALEGFLRGQGITLDQVRYESTPKGEYLAATVIRPGVSARAALEKAIPLALAALQFPKTMKWEPTGARFARPIRWIVALLDGEPLDVAFADVHSGTHSAGHRFYHPSFFDLKGLGKGCSGDEMKDGYTRLMREHGVMVYSNDRRATIKNELFRLCEQHSAAPREDEELESITSDLVEWPAVVWGSFDPSYLALPEAVIITAMREHQRYFAAHDAKTGALRNAFLCVANASLAYMQPLLAGENDPAKLDALLQPIAVGNERVLRARLDDAKYYWDTDLARWKKNAELPPEEQARPLQGITWLEGWGNLHDKAGRVARLVRELGIPLGLDEAGVKNLTHAAWLMKLDLTMEMIKDGKEYTSLEGMMGRYYARACGVAEEVTLPMAYHYLPKVSVTEPTERAYLVGHTIPAHEIPFVQGKFPPRLHHARVLTLLDKLDSVCGFLAAGKIPTGSEDPFGVRRIANGLLALFMILDVEQADEFKGRGTGSWPDRPVLRRSHLEGALRGYGDKVPADKFEPLVDSIYDFLLARLRAFLVDEPTEALNSALAAGFAPDRQVLYPRDAALRSARMAALLESAEGERAREDLFGLSLIFKRVSNILKDNTLDDSEAPVNAHSPAEAKLLSALDAAAPKVENYYRTQDYQEALKELLLLRAPIDQFFLDVMVMDEDPGVRDRRLKLLRRIRRLFLGGWDFSQVSVPATVS